MEGRRIAVKKQMRHGCVDGVVNCVKKLETREISSKSCRLNFDEERFRNFQLQEEYDIYKEEGNFPFSLLSPKPRSKIISLFATSDVVFALAKCGTGAAFSRETKKRICFLNASPDEVIQSLFYNQENDSLITLSVSASDISSTLICRSTSIEYIRRGDPDAGFLLFESESIDFVEFDYVNGKVIIQCEKDKTYKVFDLKNYSFQYSITDKSVQGIEIGGRGILVLICKTRMGFPLKLISVEDGTVVKSFNDLLRKKKKIIFVAQYKEKLIVKQEKENMKIVDVTSSHITEVRRTESLTPSAIFFCNHLFLTLTSQTAMLWNLRGELVTSFEGHLLWHPDYDAHNVYHVARKDSFIISYRKADSSENAHGSISISNIMTGKSVGKITATDSRKGSKIESTLAEALKDITALYYDEESNEIYTSNKLGRIHVWTN